MQKIAIFAIMVLGVAQASFVPVKHVSSLNSLLAKEFNVPSPRADMTEWLDEIFANLRRLMIDNGMDTIAIPNFGWNFSEVVLGVRWHGEAYIEEGYLKGIETLHRTGIAELTYEENGDLIVAVDAGVNIGTLGAKLTVQFMNLGPVATISGTLKNVAVKLMLRVRTVGGTTAKLEQLNIKSLGTLSINVQGLGIILNFLVESVVYIFGNLVKDVVATLFELPIKALINSILSTLLPPRSLASYAAVKHPAVIIPRVLPYAV